MTAEGLLRLKQTTSPHPGVPTQTPNSYASMISPGSIKQPLRYVCLDAFLTLQPHGTRNLCSASGLKARRLQTPKCGIFNPVHHVNLTTTPNPETANSPTWPNYRSPTTGHVPSKFAGPADCAERRKPCMRNPDLIFET